jgi:hypothetical protein
MKKGESMVKTEEIDKFIASNRWHKVLRIALESDCSEECLRKIIKHLISEKLVSFYGEFEWLDFDCLPIDSIHVFLRTCYCLRKGPDKMAVPDIIQLGRIGKLPIIAIPSREFKERLKYDETIVIF